MKLSTKTLLILLIISQLIISKGKLYSEAPAQMELNNVKRIRFQIATIEEREGERNIFSTATVEGPPGTDFTVNLQEGRFKMNAKFLIDLIKENELRVRAKLNTRRLYGYSERSLPLYEEDAQNQAMKLGFD